ncbi:polyisoprenoid-binding protein YceI [Actinomadura rupiterrae]|nr:polyisoprenoid-binding protein YceI [Actinomadura rupiterrae]
MSTLTRLDELAGDYVLDAGRSRIGFVAKHTGGSRVRGHFERFEGSAHLDAGDPSRSSVRLTIRADSFQTGSGIRDKLVLKQYLRAQDHATASFTST